MARTQVRPVQVTFLSSHSQPGGSEAYLEQLVRRLGPAWALSVICLQEGPLVDRFRAQGIRTEVIGTGARPWSIAWSARRLRTALKNDPSDVVHANGVKAALVAVLAGAQPIVWVKHDFSWDGPLTRWIAKRCSMVVGVSDAVLEEVRQVSRTAVAYNGIAPVTVDRARSSELVHELVGSSSETVILVGRMHPVKGHLELLEAGPAILKKRPDARLLFVGGPDPATPDVETEVRSRAESLGIADRVTFAGHRDDATELMAGADVAVIPSVRVSARQGREGFPLVGLELMAAGTPVVAYSSGGVPELLGDCGVLVAPGDRDALAGAIVELLRDEQKRRALSRCGIARVSERFTLDGLVETMKGHYLEVSPR